MLVERGVRQRLARRPEEELVAQFVLQTRVSGTQAKTRTAAFSRLVLGRSRSTPCYARAGGKGAENVCASEPFSMMGPSTTSPQRSVLHEGSEETHFPGHAYVLAKNGCISTFEPRGVNVVRGGLVFANTLSLTALVAGEDFRIA